MKTEKLRDALEVLRSYALVASQSEAEYHTNTKLANEAQQELSELQRLVDVVKGFIDDNELCDEESLYYTVSKNPDKSYELISSLCNIVGYKE